MNTNWKNWVFNKAERLFRSDTPLPAKELAWRGVRFAVRCGKSNPVSFALRPLVFHRHLRTAVGVNLAILAIGLAIFGPLPSLAGTGMGGEVSIAGTGEVTLSTRPGVRIPISNFQISQRYWALHSGLDMRAPSGTAIQPIMAGIVTKVESDRWGYGKMAVVTHGAEYGSLYAHMSQINVSEGQEVSQDTVIGLVGSTGRSTGPHLHLEIHENGRSVNPAQILGLK